MAPAPVRGWIGRGAERVSRTQLDTFARGCFGARWKPVDKGIPGPYDIILRTAVLHEHEIQTTTTASYYFSSGYSQVLAYLKVLARNGFAFDRVRDVLEFGVGSARLLRHWRSVEGLRLVGSDVDADSIAWCRENVPGIAFQVNRIEPPLDFAAHESFDLVYASSVFTHIDLKHQDAWLAELGRVLRPGAFLIADVHGVECRRAVLSPEQERIVQEKGGLVVYPNEAGSSISTDIIGSCDTFQTEAATRHAFGKYFEIVDYISRNRDLLVCRKKPVVESSRTN